MKQFLGIVAATAAALFSVAALAIVQMAPIANAEAAPGAFAPAAPPPGGGIWQVAGIVNAGEPSIRIAYDQTYPGAYARAASILSSLQSRYSYLPQPGVTTGLPEIGFTAETYGVQLQLYSTSPYLTGEFVQWFVDAGMPLTMCTPSISGCPGSGTGSLP